MTDPQDDPVDHPRHYAFGSIEVIDLRTSERAHPQMREVMRPLLAEFRRRVPVMFDDAGKAG